MMPSDDSLFRVKRVSKQIMVNKYSPPSHGHTHAVHTQTSTKTGRGGYLYHQLFVAGSSLGRVDDSNRKGMLTSGRGGEDQ